MKLSLIISFPWLANTLCDKLHRYSLCFCLYLLGSQKCYTWFTRLSWNPKGVSPFCASSTKSRRCHRSFCCFSPFSLRPISFQCEQEYCSGSSILGNWSGGLFQCSAVSFQWPEDDCSLLFQCKLVGKAQEACVSLSVEDNLVYDKVKSAFLKASALAYKQCFHNVGKTSSQTCVEFARKEEYSLTDGTKRAKLSTSTHYVSSCYKSSGTVLQHELCFI